MLVYAGIDEAGYGPLFGPLVIARTVFTVDRADPGVPPPSLWRTMQGTICRLPGDPQGRIPINDSKRLYLPGALEHLERGVLGFLEQLPLRPASMQELLDGLGYDKLSRRPSHPCYADPSLPTIPSRLSTAELVQARRRLAAAGERSGVRLLEVSAAIILEDRFNRLVTDCGNKALCAWTFVAGHLQAIWSRYGERRPQVIIDRQGGRIYYLDLLARLFPQARLCILKETPALSRYLISEEGREMEITVQVQSELKHLPAALSSMIAKYLRELLMQRFQAFWRQAAPSVRPTCGYHRDGRRFLQEIEPLFSSLRIEPETLVRRC